MKLFNSKVILTSKNKEAFLSFSWDGNDYRIIPNCNVADGYLYVNGLDINVYEASMGYSLLLDSDNRMCTFHIYTPLNIDFDASLLFSFWDVSLNVATPKTTPVSISNRPTLLLNRDINNFNVGNLIDDEIDSHLILRTNPKLTGNIKLIVNENNEMFLDTFKISDALSNKKYRKQKISANSIFSGDIRNVFSSLPLGELYRIDEQDTLDIKLPKTELKKQYSITYNYGASLLGDELYEEDNILLAPLWINQKLPDYFSIFRLPGSYNEETYNYSISEEFILKYLKNSDIIKTWSFKENSELGKYLNSHINEIEYQSPIFLSLSNITQELSDPNTWYGIAIDKGIITGRSETTYFFNQKANNFTNLNAFITEGFERNSLLCPNLINMSFIFSDNDVSLYSMNRYFGLYLKENILYNIAYYSDTSTGNISILSLDDKDISTFINSTIFTHNNLREDYKNRLFVLNDGKDLRRIKGKSDITGELNRIYCNKPKENIFSTKVDIIETNPFITLTLNNKLKQGEHLRVINHTQNKIWEIYAVDTSVNCDSYITITDASGVFPTIYRTNFNSAGDIPEQIQQISIAFDKFSEYDDCPIRAGVYSSSSVNLLLNDDASLNNLWYFQRITSSTLEDEYLNSINTGDASIGFKRTASPDDITYYGVYTPTIEEFTRIDYDASFGPIDFELYGDRQLFTINFIKPGQKYLYSFNNYERIISKLPKYVLYQGDDKWYRDILKININNKRFQYIKDPTSLEDRMIFITEVPVMLINSIFNGFSIHPLSLSIMGINNVKDLDYTVYDSSTIFKDNQMNFKSEYHYNRNDDISTYYLNINSGDSYILDIRDSFKIISGTGTLNNTIYNSGDIFNTFDNNITINASTNTIITYDELDGSTNYLGLNPHVSEELISSYYDSSTTLKYSLTAPYICKWVGLGSDCRNNKQKLVLDKSLFNINSNFTPTDNYFSEEITYPSYKYLTPGERAWENYTFYDINDVILSKNSTIKYLMLNNPWVDYFSKILLSNKNVNNITNRSSVCYYNMYKNSIDVTLLGVKYSLKINDIAKNILDIKSYNGFKFSFISTPTKNYDSSKPIEIIINENLKTILIIWYQGNDELNYNIRKSTYIRGKNILDSSSNGFVTGRFETNHYSYAKAPFIVNNSIIQKRCINVYDKKDGINEIYPIRIVQPFAQFNKNENNLNSVFIAPGLNQLSDNIFYVENGTNSYNTFAQYIKTEYNPDSNTFGSYVSNNAYNYNSNENFYKNSTTDIKTLKYLISAIHRNIMVYVLRGNDMYTNLDFGNNVSPILIEINEPKNYNDFISYNGWFKPKLIDIFNFTSNEDGDVIDTLQQDFISCNTNVSDCNQISQLWYNVVKNSITSEDLINGNAINYHENFNIFSSQWDRDFYILNNSPIDGYNCSTELPNFFGSKLPKLPNSIILNNWNSTTLKKTMLSSGRELLHFNLSKAILNIFKNNINFISNWSPFNAMNSSNIIDNYIIDTILKYYYISEQGVNTNIYAKSASSYEVLFNKEDNMQLDDKLNFESRIEFINNEYIYKIYIPSEFRFKYFIEFEIKEK